MLLPIPDVLTPDQVAQMRATLASVDWEDGRITAGHQAQRVKRNRQITESHPVAKALGEIVLRQLAQNALFTAAALPLKVFPPLFNCYEGGGHFGGHIDTAVRLTREAPFRVRTDLSATLFLSEPDEYEGGELVIEDHYGSHSVKLPAGQLILYPATSVHEVRPVTRGARIGAFFWIQSMVRDDGQRRLLFDLDRSIQALTPQASDPAAITRLTGVYHNLLRRWADL